jgi:hypothetical protein
MFIKKGFQIRCEIEKNLPTKIFSRNVTEICIFNHVRQTCFADNFFGAFLKNVSTNLKSA